MSPDLRNKRFGNSGERGVDLAALRAAIREVPGKNRITQRSLAAALGLPLTTLHKNPVGLGLRASKSCFNPFLRDSGKLRRVQWALRWVLPSPTGHKFQSFNFVHLDEKNGSTSSKTARSATCTTTKTCRHESFNTSRTS